MLCLTSLGTCRVLFTAGVQPGLSWHLDFASGVSSVSSLDFGLLICGSSYPIDLLPTFLHLHRILLGLTTTQLSALLQDIDWRATWWMSSRHVLVDSEDLEELLQAATRFSQVAERISRSLARRVTLEEPTDNIIEWQTLEPKRAPLIANINSIRSAARFWSAEDGYPATPQECLDFAHQRFAIADHPEERCREAFLAGFLDRFNFETNTNTTQAPTIPDLSLHWIILRAPHLADPCRVLSRGEAEHLTQSFDRFSIWRAFTTEAEIEIYCVGANILVPHLLQWRSQQ